jgi:hypothetical protein
LPRRLGLERDLVEADVVRATEVATGDDRDGTPKTGAIGRTSMCSCRERRSSSGLIAP